LKLRFRHIALLIVSVSAILCIDASASYADNQLNKVKAVFLFKFFDYVSWHESAPQQQTLCTLGPHPFGNMLNEISHLRQKEHMRVVALKSIKDASICQVLYIHKKSDEYSLSNQALDYTLVVGDDFDFIKNGGVIIMAERSGKINLTIDLKQAEKNKLKISSRLLGIADVLR
jgi:hypothetical protein